MNHLGTKRIETKRLVLRPFTMEDAPAMYRNWASSSSVTKYLTWPAHTDPKVTEQVLADWVAAYESNNKYEWCIELKEINEPIGSLGVVCINEKVKAMEIGYCIGSQWWHQGITSEAVSAIVTFLMEEVKADRIEARHDTRNPYSGQVIKKCGFQYEGTKIRAEWCNAGIGSVSYYGLVHPQKKTIADETIRYVSLLAKLELSQKENAQAKEDVERMLTFFEGMNRLNTAEAEPQSHVFTIRNVFREDVEEPKDNPKNAKVNTSALSTRGFQVPRTID